MIRAMRKFGIAVVVALVAAFAIVPVTAQDAPPVMILPVDGAQFLPGALFDIRVEVHADELPGDFSVTLNGDNVMDSAEMTSWTAEDSLIGVAAQALTWRGMSLDEPGNYTFEVTAGGETHTAEWTVREPAGERVAQNIILFIPDGGSVAVNTAARLVSRGMDQGFYNDRLVFETWEEIGLISTSGLDSIITDSANSASSYNTGHKSAVNATGVYPDTSRDAFDDPRVETFAQMIKRTLGMSVGIVTTAEYVDATPAAVWGHSRQRTNQTRADYALQAIGEGVIADRVPDLMPEVILGGGSRYLIPASIDGSRRGDEIDVLSLYEAAGYTIAETATQMQEAVDNGTEMLAGFFHPGNMSVWLDRNVYTDNLGVFTDQPGLDDMMIAALEVLNQNENGFYLQVEAASVDKALHPMDFERAIADMIELDVAIRATMEWLEANGELDNTLMIIVPDHAHSFDVWGVVDVEAFNAADNDVDRRNAIGVYQAAGFPTYEDADGDYFPDNWDVSRTLAWGKADFPEFTENYQVSPVYRTPAVRGEDGVYRQNPEDDPNGIFMNGNLPAGASTSVHTLQDVPVYAQGPGSAYVGRNMENFEIFFAMANALGLDPRNAE